MFVGLRSRDVASRSCTTSSTTGAARESSARTPVWTSRRVDPSIELVAVDEAQFFGPELLDVVQRGADSGLVMIVAGLDVTFDGRPFEPIPALGALAERADRLTAVCTVCGEDAPFHERVVATTDGDALTAGAEHVGGLETYQARCRVHFTAARWRAGAPGAAVVDDPTVRNR